MEKKNWTVAIEGAVETVYPPRTVGAGDKSIREIVIVDDTEGAWPHRASVEFWGDLAAKLDGIKPGTTVRVAFRPETRKWTPPSGGAEKRFTSLKGVDIAPTGVVAPAAQEGKDAGPDPDWDAPF